MQVLFSPLMLAGAANLIVIPKSARPIGSPLDLLTAPEPQPEMVRVTLAAELAPDVSPGSVADNVGAVPLVNEDGEIGKVGALSTGAAITTTGTVAIRVGS